MSRHDETDGWIFSDEGHEWQNDQHFLHGWCFVLLFSLKEDIETGGADLIWGKARDNSRTSWHPGFNLVLDE